MSRPDVVVVGAGIVGLSIAVQLAERGASVTVVERSGVGAGASGVQPGGVRQQWGTRMNCVLARESMSYYADVYERLRMRVDPGFRPCGYLFLAHSDGALDRMRQNVALQNALGVPSRIVAPVEAAELVPALDVAGVTGGAFCAEDGYFDRPQTILEALGALVDLQLDEVLAVRAGGRVRLSHAGDLDTDAVVVAAGVDTPRLLPGLPIRAEPRYLFFSDPVRERLLEPLVVSVERRLAAKHLADGRLLVSNLAASGDPQTEAPRWRAAVREALEELLPRLVYVPLPLLVAGTYDVTPDHQAILGEVRDRVWVAAGFSGHGFMHAPAVARILAEALVGGREDEALRLLDAARFDEGRPLPEPQVV
jgi:glycine/D-amino acid oxidase-like deaminating enzyme